MSSFIRIVTTAVLVFLIAGFTALAGNLLSKNNFSKTAPAPEFRHAMPELISSGKPGKEIATEKPKARGEEFFVADKAGGVIGSPQGRFFDQPADNVFLIDIDQNINASDRVWLSYEVKGVEDHRSVARTINDGVSIGGYLVDTSGTWKPQMEEVPVHQLKKGINIVRFGLHEEAEIYYEIREVGFLVRRAAEKSDDPTQVRVVQEDLTVKNGQAYLKGYLPNWDGEKKGVRVNGCEAIFHNGSFEAFFPVGEKKVGELCSLEVEVSGEKDFMRTSHSFDLPVSAEADHMYVFRDEMPYTQGVCQKGQALALELNAIKVTIENQDIYPPLALSLTGLRQWDLPALGSGMINVTAQDRGYRLAPGRMIFEAPIEVELAFDPEKLPNGYTVDDVRPFRYDYQKGRWIELERSRVDMSKGTVRANTDQGGDYITGIIVVPESPETRGYAPTEMQNLQAGNPAAEILQMEIPKASSMGTANLTFPFKLPPARRGVGPGLALSYSSDGDHSWCGLGWSLDQPAITLDTRWGVPRYSPEKETEIYLLNGQQLNYKPSADESYMPHRDTLIDRLSGETRFYPRVEGTFHKIIRHGNSPKDYWWEVTDKTGMRYFYGGLPGSGLDSAAVLQDYEGNVAHWALLEIRDLNGNFARYHYATVIDSLNGPNPGYELYPKEITYTGHDQEEGKYRVIFIRDRELGETPRVDVDIDGRLAFKRVTADLLRRVEVRLENDPIRSYELQYTLGAFPKSLLSDIIEYDAAGEELARHSFEYYDDVRQDSAYVPYEEQAFAWGNPDDDVKGNLLVPLSTNETSAISGSSSRGGGAGTEVGVGLCGPPNKLFTVGVDFDYSSYSSEGLINLIDINGDALPDKVYKSQSGLAARLVYRPNQNTGPDNKLSFGQEALTIGVNDFSRSRSTSVTIGGVAHPGPYVRVGVSNTDIDTRTTTYFTDYNGDGLMDIAHGGRIYFNCFEPDNTTTIPFYVNTNLTRNPIVKGEKITSAIFEMDPAEQEALAKQYPLHDVVRVWKAPWAGNVVISGEGPITLNDLPAAQEYPYRDGVIASIERFTIGKDLFGNDVPIQLVLWSDTLSADTKLSIPVSAYQNTETLRKDDLLFFRLHSIMDGAYDQVHWDPIIEYTNPALVEEDANGLDQAYYQYSEDFLLAGDQQIITSRKGKLNITGSFEKTDLTSDSLTLFAYRKDTFNTVDTLFWLPLSWDTTGVFPTDSLDIAVEKLDTFQFKVLTNTTIDFTSINWNVRMYYTEAFNDTNGIAPAIIADTIVLPDTQYILYDTLFDIYPLVDYNLFDRVVQRTDSIRLPMLIFLDTIPIDIQAPDVSIFPNLLPQHNGKVTLSIKGRKRLYAKASYEIIDGEEVGDTLLQYEFTEPEDSLIFIECFVESTSEDYTSQELAEAILNKLIVTDTIFDKGQIGVYTKVDSDDRKYGHLYRGWGQFIYNASLDTNGYNPIQVNKLAVELYNANDRNLASNADDPDDLADFQSTGTWLQYMVPEIQRQAWVGLDPLTYVKTDSISSSRLGQKNIKPDTITGAANDASSFPAVTKKESASAVSFSAGGGLGVNLGISWATGNQETKLDLMDFDGDRYPDVVSSRYILQTNMRGGYESASDLIDHGLGGHTAESEALGLSAGASVNVPKFNNSNKTNSANNGKGQAHKTAGSQSKNAGDAEETANLSFSLGGNMNLNLDEAQHSWLDVNGDDLPDKLYANGEVALNIGRSFLPREPWNFSGIRKGRSNDFGINAGVGVGLVGSNGGDGVSVANGSFQFGVGATLTTNSTTQTLQDVNSDGLVDIVRLVCLNIPDTLDLDDPNAILAGGLGNTLPDEECFVNVHFNTGHGFEPLPVAWPGYEAIDEGSASGESANEAFTVAINIPLVFACIRVSVNPSAHLGRGLSRQHTQLTDMDGDGHDDFITSRDGDDDLRVKRSTIGRTNMLKTVHRPLGSSFTVAYEAQLKSFANPTTIWAMTDLVIYDGFVSDGVDTMRLRYSYADGYYDRREREFYGYRKVITEELDETQAPYRRSVSTFANDNYYEKGLLVSDTLVRAEDEAVFTVNHFNYTFLNVVTGDVMDDAVVKASDKGNAFPALTSTQAVFFEGTGVPQKATQMTYSYDAYGNVIRYTDYGDMLPGAPLSDVTPDDNYITGLEYHEVPANYIVGIPSGIEVQNDAGDILRKRSTQIDENTGNIEVVELYADAGTVSRYDFDFDDYGNMEQVSRPENHKGERLTYDYAYDPFVHTYPDTVTDGYGYTSSCVYDYRFGKLLLSKDINGQEVQYTLDDAGRISTITGPYELASGAPFTLHFEYHPQATVPWALTQHYDPQYPGNLLETATFVDGLERVIQVKKDAEIYDPNTNTSEEKRIVSGTDLFDAFGRIVTSYYPVEEDLATPIGNFNPAVDVITPTEFTYDRLDRSLTTTLPDGSETTVEYNFGNDRDNKLQFLTRITDALGNVKDHFINVRGLKTGLLAYIDDAPDHGDLWTSYQYDAVNQLVSALDDANNAITWKYDWLGREVANIHPDRGETLLFYDPAGNLRRKQTANILAYNAQNSLDTAIIYGYDHERLQEILYPIYGSNNVYFEYGRPDSANDVKYNRMGRVSIQVDATGSQIFFYDRLGEVNKNIRTISAVPGRPPRSFVTRYKYDTWNRLTRMVYPDGEVLNYTYNRGGKLLTMSSTKLGVDYSYIQEMGFDKFDARVYCRYGNGAETVYSYEPERGRLQRMLVRSGSPNPRRIMDHAYTYDAVSNVTRVKNNPRMPINDMGGPAEYRYAYDDLYRLVSAQGYWGNYQQVQKFELEMTYNNLHDITQKYQYHQRAFGAFIDPDVVNPDDPIDWDGVDQATTWQNASNITSHNLQYEYDHGDKPHAATDIGLHTYDYDRNGNTVSREHKVYIGQTRYMEWDEENRLNLLDDDERIHLYRYDADGTRVVKRKDIANYIYVNGQIVIGDSLDGEYVVYVNPYMVINEHGYTKHFFVEGQRIASKVGLGGPYGLGGNWGDWANWTEWEPWDNWANNDDWDNWYNNGDWEADDGIWNNWQNVNEYYRYFFHADQIGSSSHITDRYGEVHQHLEYFPFGEVFVHEHKNFDRTPYLHIGMELDEETGLYAFPVRYFDPHIARWLKVDPLAENQPALSGYSYTLNNPVSPLAVGFMNMEYAWNASGFSMDLLRLDDAAGGSPQSPFLDDDDVIEDMAELTPQISEGGSLAIKRDKKKIQQNFSSQNQEKKKGEEAKDAGKLNQKTRKPAKSIAEDQQPTPAVNREETLPPEDQGPPRLERMKAIRQIIRVPTPVDPLQPRLERMKAVKIIRVKTPKTD